VSSIVCVGMTDELTANAKITWSAKRNVAGSKAADVLVATKSAYKDRLKAWRSVVLLSEEQLASLEESLGDKRYNRKNFNDAVKALRQQDGKTTSSDIASAAESLANMTSSTD